MERGYTAQIGNEFVFVIAKNIEEAKTKLIKKSNGKEWLMNHTRNFKVLK